MSDPRAQALPHQALLDALTYSACVLDHDGTIVAVNAAWRTFAQENGGDPVRTSDGSYLAACEGATGADASYARVAAAGIRAVLGGERTACEYEYPCHSPDAQHWFLAKVSRLEGGEAASALVQHVEITQQKVLEFRLQQSQALAHIGSWELDHRTNRVWWSDETYRIFGLAPGAGPLSFETCSSAVHVDDREIAGARFRESLEQRAGYDLAHRLLCPDGRVKQVRVQVRHTFDPDGLPLRSEGTIQDISDLQKAQARLRDILNSMFAFVAVCDREGNAVDVNRAQLNATGAKREDFVGRPFWETYGWSYSAELRQTIRAVLARAASGETVRADYLVRMGKEVFNTIDATFAPLRDPSGHIEGVVGSAVDVTAQRRAEAQLIEAQRIAKLGSWDLDLNTNELHWSPQVFEIFEIDEARFGATYEAFLDAAHPDDRGMVHEGFTSAVSERRPYDLRHRLLMADGRIKHVHERGETTYDAAGRPLRTTGTVLDITERRDAELRVEAALEEKETLLREIHHRVKNNLQIVSSLLHFQSKKVTDPAAIVVFGEARNRLRSMMLVHERLYRTGDLAHIDFGDYLQALTEDLASSYPAAGARVSAHVEGPSPKLPVEVVLPAGMLLNELVTNSLKHAFEGKDGGAVRVAIGTDHDTLVLSVEDDGVGLSALSPEPPTFGLQLVQNLVRQLAATIELGPGPGTKLTVRVPISAHLASGSPAPKELS